MPALIYARSHSHPSRRRKCQTTNVGDSSPFHQQEVNSQISQHQEAGTKCRQTYSIIPQVQDLETKRAQNRSAWHIDIKAVLFVKQTQIADFIDNEAFEAKVEDGELK